jgi:3-oxoacyl-[acyl-carrier protein] reductase
VNAPLARRALVTGGASGLTAGIAAAIAGDGFGSITITYRNGNPQPVLDRISSTGVRARAARVDFRGDGDDIAAVLASVVAEEGPFDTLVHGVGALDVKRFERFTLEDYDEAFESNVRSAVIAVQAVLPAMRAASFGRIVVFGENGSSQTAPHPGMTLHQAAKSALVAFAKTLALEEARHGITVNAIEIGDIRDKARTREQARDVSSPIPRGLAGSVDDVADVVRFLIAPERDFVTGAVIAVTGGLTAADERNATRS